MVHVWINCFLVLKQCLEPRALLWLCKASRTSFTNDRKLHRKSKLSFFFFFFRRYEKEQKNSFLLSLEVSLSHIGKRTNESQISFINNITSLLRSQLAIQPEAHHKTLAHVIQVLSHGNNIVSSKKKVLKQNIPSVFLFLSNTRELSPLCK